MSKTRDGSDEIGTLVHDNDGICSETRLDIFQRIVVHAGETEAFNSELRATERERRLTELLRIRLLGKRGQSHHPVRYLTGYPNHR